MAKFKLVFEVHDMALPEADRASPANLVYEKSQIVIDIGDDFEKFVAEQKVLPFATDELVAAVSEHWLAEQVQAAMVIMMVAVAKEVVERVLPRSSAALVVTKH